MAKQTIEKLINGDLGILDSYMKVRDEWIKILEGFDWNDPDAVDNMAMLVTNHQLNMEFIAGERWLGQEIMVIVGIGQFYSSEIGFDEDIKKAIIVYNGFLSSMCSIEVKFYAETVGELYRINEYIEDLNS